METGVEDGCKVQRNKGEGDRGRLRWEAKEQGRGWGENRKGEGGGETRAKTESGKKGEEEDWTGGHDTQGQKFQKQNTLMLTPEASEKSVRPSALCE